jgi:peptide/nickel transport system permease protein
MEQSERLSANDQQSDQIFLDRRSNSWKSSIFQFVRSAPMAVVAATVLVLIAITAIFADQIAPYPPLQTNYMATQSPPSRDNLLGTDHLGRDVLSRIIHGTRITLLVSTASVGIGVAVGLSWGLISGFLGNRFDIISQRLIEILMAFPTLILAMLLVVSLGAGLTTVIVAVGITQIPLTTRITRSIVLSVKELPYVDAAICIGASNLRVMFKHIAPQCVAAVLVVATVNLGGAIFAEAGLSFLGVGIPPPDPSWGNMLGGVLAEAFRPPWWLVIFPGVAIIVTVLAANLLGDGLRDWFDPKLK